MLLYGRITIKYAEILHLNTKYNTNLKKISRLETYILLSLMKRILDTYIYL